MQHLVGGLKIEPYFFWFGRTCLLKKGAEELGQNIWISGLITQISHRLILVQSHQKVRKTFAFRVPFSHLLTNRLRWVKIDQLSHIIYLPFTDQPLKRRKRHRRKQVQNQEPCLMRGVYYKNMKWQAAIKVEKRQIHLGTFTSQEEAARLYDR